MGKSFQNNRERITPLLSCPAEIRKAIYTTITIESLNMSLRKVSKNRALPSDD
ncbi:MAG: transposase [Proteobacteria bacterium]|nr:transposase [Pseudomonadota bacterium]MBU1738394.1 transposase [Pseudomonadota bacterium]